jgi:hypothetical protein
MAEVYSDRGTHRSGMTWILLAVLAVIIFAIVIALVR